MELTNHHATDARAEMPIIRKPNQTNAWLPATHRGQAANVKTPGLLEFSQSEESQESIGKIHACKASQRGFHEAGERLKRANRDLGETAAFIAASLTTVTAVEAVINIAIDKLDLSKDVLQVALNAYIAIFMLIILWGAFRARNALRRRSLAERDIDQAQRAIFEFCSDKQWPKPEE